MREETNNNMPRRRKSKPLHQKYGVLSPRSWPSLAGENLTRAHGAVAFFAISASRCITTTGVDITDAELQTKIRDFWSNELTPVGGLIRLEGPDAAVRERPPMLLNEKCAKYN